ncbi:MAG: glutathione S-transferase [Candidatus Eremiobacteraeota bacterium]|nr:glutathione S-transferase [Candidatus Eremiobacteraeota bacterium]
MSNLYLVTMGPSPYSEKARWALDLLGRSYTEERCIPGLHRPALKRIQAGLTCPALVVNKKELFTDSSDILRWVDGQLPGHQKLFPEDPIQGSVVKDFCQRCDAKLAPEVIAFVQTYLTRAQFVELCSKGAAEEQLKKFKWMSFFIHLGVKSKLKLNPSNFKMSVKRIGQFFESVDHLLHGGKNYLYGDRLSAADIVFAAYAGAALCIPEYGGNALNFQDAPDEVREEVKRWRETPAGKFVQSLYKDWRKRRL